MFCMKERTPMAKFCRYCGSPVQEDSRFCGACGKPLVGVEPQARTQPQIKPSAPVQKSTAVQKPEPTKKRVSSQKKTAAQKAETTKVSDGYIGNLSPRQRAAHEQAEKAKAAMKPQIKEVTAAAAAGEIDCGTFHLPASIPLPQIPGTSAARVSEVLSPVSGILKTAGSFIGGIFSVFKNPKAMIGTAVLAALWFVLGMLRDSDSEIVKFLSWLTFAEGGFDRSPAGTVFGVLGKGTVAAALISLLSGGIPNALKGLGALIKGHGEKRGILNILLGFILGRILYALFVGPGALSASTTMAGIAGAVLCLEALGSGNGKLYMLLESMTSRMKNGVRTAMRGKCDGLLTGLTLGLALTAAMSAFI